MNIKKSVQNNFVFQIITNPNVYLKELIWRTLGLGLATFCIILAINYFNLESLTIPASMHSLIGIVIGLLLVFRSNTAYDRWWEGRKTISSISNEISVISARLNVLKTDSNKEALDQIRTTLSKLLTSLRHYLKSGADGEESISFHIEQKKLIEEALITLNSLDQQDSNVDAISKSITKLIENSNTLERIKNTPIPLSYKFHIKISILMYLLTLPFGMFHELGIWATPLIMLVHYVISGVEIISNEIENPFADDPNDLPTEKLFNVIEKTLWD